MYINIRVRFIYMILIKLEFSRQIFEKYSQIKGSRNLFRTLKRSLCFCFFFFFFFFFVFVFFFVVVVVVFFFLGVPSPLFV